MEDLKDIEVLVGLEPKETELVRVALTAAGMRMLPAVATPGEFLAQCIQAEPDVGIVGFTIGGRPTLELMRAIRKGRQGVNRFMPVLMATANPDRRAVQLALTAGAHEVLALPTSVRVIQALMHRAVFVGRPFVQTDTYVGPCRRRKPMTWIRPERRTVWAGYVHPSHKAYEFEAA